MLCDMGEVPHLEDLIESDYILQFYLIKRGTLILEGWFNFPFNLATEFL